MKNPCEKYCQLRTGTCHATCKEYNDFYEWKKEERKKKRLRGNVDGYIKDAVLASKKSSRNWRV